MGQKEGFGRYIIRPRFTSVQSLSLATRSMDRGRRGTQIKEVRDLRVTDPATREVKDWCRANNGRLITDSETATPVTGATVVDLPETKAEELRDQRPDVLVLRDQPIPLIDPRRPAGLANNKKDVAAEDLWHLRAIGLTAARKKKFKGTGDGVTVAVLDTGVDAAHPELADRVAAAFTFDTDAWTAHPQPASQDTDGHGTHVAGLICGRRVGVAPAARVVSGVMLPKGMGRLSDFLLALEWVASRDDVQVVNVSAGIRGWVDGMQTMISDLLLVGVLPVVATGNEGRNKARSPGNYPEVFSVGAANSGNQVSDFSSGAQMLSTDHVQYFVPDVVAPGEQVYSCVKGGGYEAWDGTSMATPIVSGIVALILERYQTISVTQLQQELLNTCLTLGDTPDRQGKGLVQVTAAIPAPSPRTRPAGPAPRGPAPRGPAPRGGRRRLPPPPLAAGADKAKSVKKTVRAKKAGRAKAAGTARGRKTGGGGSGPGR